MSVPFIFPCSLNSVPFYPSVSMRRSLDAIPNIGQSSYIDSLLYWQSKLRYKNKRLFNDVITFQFKTQRNNDPTPGIQPQHSIPLIFSPTYHQEVWIYDNPAKLHVCKSKIGSEGYPVPGEIIAAFDAELNETTLGSNNYPLAPGSNFWGIQAAPYDFYQDPIIGTKTNLVSYMWQFTFGDQLSYLTDSGIYFLRFDYYDSTNELTTWYSEPIFVYGNDSRYTFPDSLEFEATNIINKNDLIINGWFNNVGKQVVMTTRVEGDILDYNPKGIYMGYLQQDWLASNTYTKSWETWSLSIGNDHRGAGVPLTMFRILTKFLEMDYVLINNQYYTYDVASGGSQSAIDAWKMEKNRVKGLYKGSLPVRYKFDQASQFFIGSPITLPRIFDSTFDGVFA